MTEAEWLACTDPQKLLKFLHSRASERKRRLFAAACCRRVWHLLRDERSRHAVETAERYADEEATGKDLDDAEEEAQDAYTAVKEAGTAAMLEAANAVYVTAVKGVKWDIAGCAAGSAADAVKASAARGKQKAARQEETAIQVGLLRCVFGNPFQPVTLDPGWLAWKRGAAAKLAQAVYAERDFARLPVLADALEEAGCDNADVFAHCRESGEHVRGCWVVDLILGKT
jgi:hypothetical protein